VGHRWGYSSEAQRHPPWSIRGGHRLLFTSTFSMKKAFMKDIATLPTYISHYFDPLS